MTRGLDAPELDVAVATLEGYTAVVDRQEAVTVDGLWPYTFQFSTCWAFSGPIVEREKIDLDHMNGRAPHVAWRALCGPGRAEGFGPTALVAAMRAYVASRK